MDPRDEVKILRDRLERVECALEVLRASVRFHVKFVKPEHWIGPVLRVSLARADAIMAGDVEPIEITDTPERPDD